MLSKVGAVKSRNAQNKVIYRVPDELLVPRIGYPIDSILLLIKSNSTQIIIKTVSGGASIIARVLDSLDSSFGILGTIAGDDTVLIIPSDSRNIQEIIIKISDSFELDD